MSGRQRLRTFRIALLLLLLAVVIDFTAGAVEGLFADEPAGRARAADSGPTIDPLEKTAKFVSYWEGFSARCDDSLDGFATIGFGHVLRFSACNPSDQALVWSREEALLQLRADLEQADRAVRRLVRVPLKPQMRSALVSFTFNVGENGLAESTLLGLLNRGHYRAAADQMTRWIYGPGPTLLPGLVRRRESERRLFLKP